MQSSSSTHPLVTVVIPTIGRPEYIVDTVRSVLAQSYPHLQVLISDNAPREPTRSLLSASGIVDPRIEIVERLTRMAFSAHMNACIDLARGTYLMILSDDDQITPGYVAEMVEVMQSQQDITVCVGRQVKITEHDRGVLPCPGLTHERLIVDGHEFLARTLAGTLKTHVLTYISLFARKDDIVRYGGFRNYPDGAHADNFILFNLALRGRVALLSNVMFYRVYLASVGLRMPFSALLKATRRYTRDCVILMRDTTAMSPGDCRALFYALRANNSWLLVSRIRHVYAKRMPPWTLARCLLDIARFRLSRMNLR